MCFSRLRETGLLFWCVLMEYFLTLDASVNYTLKYILHCLDAVEIPLDKACYWEIMMIYL